MTAGVHVANRKIKAKAKKSRGETAFVVGYGGRWRVDKYLGDVSRQHFSQKKRRKRDKDLLSNKRGRRHRVR